MNMLATFFARGKESPQLRQHIDRIDDYLYVSEDGMKMQGYNGSQLWDTSFALQALADAPPHVVRRFEHTLRKVRRRARARVAASTQNPTSRQSLLQAHAFVDATQITEDVPQRERYFRTVSKGGWPFSTKGVQLGGAFYFFLHSMPHFGVSLSPRRPRMAHRRLHVRSHACSARCAEVGKSPTTS